MEHYFEMQEMSAQELKDGNYDVKDLMASMIETYETKYNQVLEAHKDGGRQFISEKTGIRSIVMSFFAYSLFDSVLRYDDWRHYNKKYVEARK